MKYRKFGNLEISALGFGCMRLPTEDGNPFSGNIKEKESITMIRHAIDRGVNYIDTAYPYHSGRSEILVGKALQDGYREKIKLATKSPVWFLASPEDFDKYLNEQLKKLCVEHIDFYLFHSLDRNRWNNTVLKHDLLKKAEAAIKDGRIGCIGFSFHDDCISFKEIINGYDKWAFCQIQYNYIDTKNQAGSEGLLYAASKGIPVVVMEPLLGGNLANPTEPVKNIIKGSGKEYSPANLALQWLWNLPEISTVLSGMTTMEQLNENIVSAEKSGINSLSKEDLDLVNRVREKYNENIRISCTQCAYCMPCPNGVNIPKIFEMYNKSFMMEDLKGFSRFYLSFFPEAERADNCIECYECEANCPQKIPISDWLPKVHEAFVKGNKI